MKQQNKQLVLEPLFDSNYKLYIYIMFLFVLTMNFGLVYIVPKIWFKIGGTILFMAILFMGLSIFFMKKGFVQDKAGVHRGYFAWDRLIYSSPISLLNKPNITILKFKKRERAGFVSVASMNYSSPFNSFDLYLLNDNHTQKDILMTLRNEVNANNAVQFLTEHSKLKFDIYSPNFK